MRIAVVVASAGLLALAPSAAASFRASTFRSPSGNIICVGAGDSAKPSTYGLRCDITHHSWTAPRQAKPCDAGDYGSSLGLSRRGRTRFICVSDAPPANRRTLGYGKLWRFGPFKCRMRTSGVRCVNAAAHGFTLSRSRVTRF